MSITHFKPEIWSKVLLAAFQKRLVYAGPTVVNHDYEGEISQMGDTVHISSIGDVSIQDYDAGTPIDYEDVEDAGQTMVIDQAKFFAFKVDDVDKRQAAGDLTRFVQNRASYKMADTADQYVANLYTGAASDNVLDPISTFSAYTDAYDDVLVPLGVALDDADVPSEGRYVVVPPWFHGYLLRDDRFVKVADSGTSEGLRNGIVGRAAGFDILKSNNTPSPGDNRNIVMAGVPDAISFANQITQMEALRLQDYIADGVRGLHLYGAKLVRPDGIAVVDVTNTVSP